MTAGIPTLPQDRLDLLQAGYVRQVVRRRRRSFAVLAVS
jgi:hypothetical protein